MLMESILTIFTVCLTVAFILSELFYRLGYPRVVGHILAGVFLGLPFIRVYFNRGALSFIQYLGDLGVVFLLLLVGLEVRVHHLKRVSKRAFYLAFLGYLIPLVLGFSFMRLLGFDFLTAVIVGICLAISAEAVTTDILLEYDMLKTSLGSTIMEAGMIDDFLGVLSLAAVIAVVQGGGVTDLTDIPGDFLTFIALSYLIGILVLPRAAKAVWKEKSEAAVFSLAVIFGLFIVMLSNIFDLSSVIGAFVAGVIIQITIKNRREEKEIVDSLSTVTFGLVVPFFFIYVGMNFDITMVGDLLYLIVPFVFLGLSGKIVAAQLTGSRFHMHRLDRGLMGWGINPRGAVELVIANIARVNNLISDEIFSAIVAMTIIAAVVSPIMFRRTLRKRTRQARH
ncbi:MAG: hypothetical protein GF416_08610 [Candidatus Altiarchaeales archaeon]|nr:hypothetical protein [Candidatus Altiarchaeales archaeon]MBD3417177.1 hypothetical protein [Candidatus Altiarchaeales archaeon]